MVVTHNLRIALANNTPLKRFSDDFIHLNILFSSVLKHRTDLCSVSCFLDPPNTTTTISMPVLLFGYRGYLFSL